jgi:hypothetical protein
MEYISIIGYIATALSTILVTIFGSKWFGDIIGYKIKKTNPNQPKLINHNIFNIIEEVRNDIRRVEFFIDKDELINDHTKELMFIDFMNHKLDSTYDHTYRFISQEDDLIHVTKTDLHNRMVVLVNTIIMEYTSNTRNTFLNKGLTLKDADYVLGLFEEWRYDTVKAMKYQIDYLFSSEYHPTNYDILLGLLEIIAFSILLIPKDGIQSFNAFNGKFSEIDYSDKI